MGKRRKRKRKAHLNGGSMVGEELDGIPAEFQRIWNKHEISKRQEQGRTLSTTTSDQIKFNRAFPHLKLWDYREMTDEECYVYLYNPHIRQVYSSMRNLARKGGPINSADRTLTSSSLRLAYQRRRNEWKTVEHWGQRKLLISEIEFLSHYASADSSDTPNVVLYIGAAPGVHLPLLASMFTQLQFILVDPLEIAVSPTDNIIAVRTEFFDDALAQTLAQQYANRLLVICDIRSQDETDHTQTNETLICQDMQDQQRWIEILAPLAAMVKFRLPYQAGSTEYLDGNVYYPVWGGKTTSETRLVVVRQEKGERYPRKVYDHNDYNDALFAFNTITRTTFFEIEPGYLSLGLGYDHCYDCAAELFVLQSYVEATTSPAENSDEIKDRVSALAKKLSHSCSLSDRTLLITEDIQYDSLFLVNCGLSQTYTFTVDEYSEGSDEEHHSKRLKCVDDGQDDTNIQ